MKRLLAAIVVVAFGMTPAPAAEPSAGCKSGVVPPSAATMGLGLRITNDTGVAKVTACNDGSFLPAPAKGAAKIVLDTNKTFVVVVFDGDRDNDMLNCTGGYVGARADGSGVHLYEAKSGTWTTSTKEKAPDTFASDLAACAA